MNRPLQRNPLFTADVQHQFGWYWDKAGEEVAWQYEAAVEETLHLILRQPEIGRLRQFSEPALRGLRSHVVTPPYNRHILFYRFAGGVIEAWRIMHGARDLPRRLLESPGAE